VGSKTALSKVLHAVLNWRCRLTQVDLYNGRSRVVDWLVGLVAQTRLWLAVVRIYELYLLA